VLVLRANDLWSWCDNTNTNPGIPNEPASLATICGFALPPRRCSNAGVGHRSGAVAMMPARSRDCRTGALNAEVCGRRRRAAPAKEIRNDDSASEWDERMGNDDKIDAKADELMGKAKEAAGRVTDDEQLETEGEGDQAKGNLKQAAEKAKDVFKD
jgi:uncharacterized protein YjbJ (UPF0337 family)